MLKLRIILPCLKSLGGVPLLLERQPKSLPQPRCMALLVIFLPTSFPFHTPISLAHCRWGVPLPPLSQTCQSHLTLWDSVLPPSAWNPLFELIHIFWSQVKRLFLREALLTLSQELYPPYSTCNSINFMALNTIIHLYNGIYMFIIECYLHEIRDLILLFTMVSAVPGIRRCTWYRFNIC